MRPLFEEGFCQLFPSFILSQFHQNLKFFMLAGKIQAIFQRKTKRSQCLSQSLFQFWNGLPNLVGSFILRLVFEELSKCTQCQRHSSIGEIGTCQPEFNLGSVGCPGMHLVHRMQITLQVSQSDVRICHQPKHICLAWELPVQLLEEVHGLLRPVFREQAISFCQSIAQSPRQMYRIRAGWKILLTQSLISSFLLTLITLKDAERHK